MFYYMLYLFLIFSEQFKHTFFPLKSKISLDSPQKIQDGENFFKIILSSSTNISRGSFTLISKVLLNSIGITTLPNLSSFRTIPVDFIKPPPKSTNNIEPSKRLPWFTKKINNKLVN